MTAHPTDLELVQWADGDLRGTPEHGALARHVMACPTCTGLVAGLGDAAYELLRTNWQELNP